LLSAWHYTNNRTVLHSDPSYLPPLAKTRSSWNYLREKQTTEVMPMSMTYDMNILHCLKTVNNYCVTLNPQKEIHKERKIDEFISGLFLRPGSGRTFATG
jgi:predicted NAD/FAD-binding protein